MRGTEGTTPGFAQARAAAQILADSLTTFLNAIGAALPLLQEGRAMLLEGATHARLADGSPSRVGLDEEARAPLAEFDRAIAYCERALREAGAR
jgi:hypothetical protein